MSKSGLSRRRFLQASLGLAAGVSLAACAAPAPQQGSADAEAGPAGGQEDVELRLMVRAGYAGQLHYEFADRFMQENPGVTVIGEDTIYGEIFKKTLAQGAVNDLQDVVFGHDRWSPFVAYKNLFLDMDPLIEASDDPALLDIYFPAILDNLRRQSPDGKLMYLPDNIDVSPSAAVYINVQLLNDAGFDIPAERDWTFTDLEEMARSIANPDENIYGFHYNPTGKESATQAWTRGWGEGPQGSEDSWFLSPDGRTVRLDGEEFPRVQEGLQWYWNLANDGVIPTGEVLASVEGGADTLFNSGQVALRIGDSSDTFDLQDSIGDKFEWTAVQKPVGPYGHRGSCIEANRWSINANTEHPDLAMELVKTLTSEDAARWAAFELFRAPLGIIAAWKDPEIIALNPVWGLSGQWLEEGVDPYPTPYNLRGIEFRDVILNEMSEWVDAKETWDEMVAHAQPAIQEVLDLELP